MGGVSNNTIPLTIGKVTNTLSLSSHTHNYIINTGDTTDATLPYSFTGLQLNSVYNGSFPYSYGNVLTLRGIGSAQIFVTWNSTQTADNNNVSQDMWIRGQRDSAGNNWSVWTRMITDKNYAGILDSRYFTETEINNKFANYYTKTESDSRFINATGDCMTGNLMIKGSNGLSTSASIHLGIGDSDTGFKWISDGVIQMYANYVAIGQWNSSGMNWYKTPTVNGTAVSLSNHGHSVLNTSGRLTCETNFAARNGIRLWEIYSNGYPFSYGNLLEISAINGVGQFACQWHGNEVYYRSAPDTSRVLTAWSRFWTSTNFNPANKLDVSTFNSTVGDISTLLDKINGTVI